MATGWHAAVSAGVREGGSVVVVGDGAVGLCGVLAASVMGAETIVAMSRHEPRQQIATEFGATHLVAERGEEGADAVKEITGGVGADAVLECVGTDDAMGTAFAVARPGSTVGFVGVPHGVELPVRRMFQKNVGLAGGMAPVRRYLPELLDLVTSGRIDPGKVFDAHDAAGRGGRGLPRHGRAARDQGAQSNRPDPQTRRGGTRPASAAGWQSQVSSQERKVWRAWPQRRHGMSCERCVSLVCTVSHIGPSSFPSCSSCDVPRR